MLLAVLEWGVVDDDMARLARQVASILTNKNARRQPSVLNKSRWNSEVITGSIHRSHYDKYSKILNFGRGNFAEQERRVADIDGGYTRFANELLEAIASADLTARQLKVMLAYVRKTYGFNKKTDRIADEQIAQLTGLSRQNVNKAKKN